MYIISKEEYENLPEEKKAEYQKGTKKYHELMKFHSDHTAVAVKQRQIEGEIISLISKYISLDRQHFDGGDTVAFSFQVIQDLINDYIKAQRKSYEEFYSPEAIVARYDKAFKVLNDKHKEIYSKNKQESN